MKIPDRIRKAVPPAAAVASGLLAASAFPPLEWKDTLWIAFVPLLIAVRHAAPGRAFRLGFAAGVVFWLASIWWLVRVTVPGMVTLALYCALYAGPFAMVAAWWMRRSGIGSWAANVGFMIAVTATWTGFEFVRSTFLTGFPWMPLGAGLYRNLVLIQVARLGGVYAVSALVVWVNAAIALTILRYVEERHRVLRHPHPELMAGFLAVVLAVVYGWRILLAPPAPAQDLRVAMIQPNIPQDDKWDESTVDVIYARLRYLTEAALRGGRPDLVIWPETAVPDDVRSSEPSYGLVYDMVTNGVPLLMGSMDTEWRDGAKPRFYNSAFLFDTNGILRHGYDKRHLVIFGEYIPFGGLLGLVNALTPIQESFSPGSTSTVFALEAPDVRFSVLICFEDTVARLARESVRNGARLLVNLTNDAWFDPSPASRQQMITCVFRCVENGVPAVRVTNTGVSCCIEKTGRVHDVLCEPDGNVRVKGFRTAGVQVPGGGMPSTPYTRHGDVFALSCAVLGLGLAGSAWKGRRPAGPA